MSILPAEWQFDRLSSHEQQRRNERTAQLVYLAILLTGLVVAFFAYRRSYQPYIGVSLAIFLILLVCWLLVPRVALGSMIALALVGDIITVSWFPFTKNLSSRESIAFLTDAVSVSPFEVVLVWALIVTAIRNVDAIGRPFRNTPLILPMLLFLAVVGVGFVTGMSRGGDMRVAIYEVRPLLYLVLFYILVVNVCTTRRDYNWMMGAAVCAIFANALISLRFYYQLPASVRDQLETVNEHGAAISMNLMFMLTFAALVFRGVPAWCRWALVGVSIPTFYLYLLSQRRAAIVALGGAIILLSIMLFWRHRRTFWYLVPVAALLVVGYTGAFWNSQSTAGFPAQAVKSVIAPGQLSAKDQSSDEYRKIERYNLVYTIRADPIQGQGFGQPFLRPVPLDDISRFEFNAYIPHNSLFWVWIKTGFVGFVTILYVLARAIASGAQRFRTAARRCGLRRGRSGRVLRGDVRGLSVPRHRLGGAQRGLTRPDVGLVHWAAARVARWGCRG